MNKAPERGYSWGFEQQVRSYDHGTKGQINVTYCSEVMETLF